VETLFVLKFLIADEMIFFSESIKLVNIHRPTNFSQAFQEIWRHNKFSMLQILFLNYSLLKSILLL